MRLCGSDIVIQVLKNRGVHTIFGYPGGNVLPLYDALAKASGLRHVLTASEAGAAHAADGLARATGRTGVCFATSGPGATNLVTGIAAAYMDSSPVVFITGNVPISQIGTDSFQEVDITGITQPVTKHNVMVRDVRRLAHELNRAFDIAQSGRKGPVLVDIPLDVQTDTCEYECEHDSADVKTNDAIVPDEFALDIAAGLINSSRRPVILAGGGTTDASCELIRLAETLQAPVTVTLTALGNMPAAHPLFAGMVGLYGSARAVKTVSESDMVIAVGVRFSDRVAAVSDEAKPLLHIDIDRSEINKNVRSRHYVVGDAGVVLRELLARTVPRFAADTRTFGEADGVIMPRSAGTAAVDPRAALSLVRKHFGDALIATDVGRHQMWAAQSIPFDRPRGWISSAGAGAMGFGLGAAVGASLATGRRTVLVTGDGSFMMNSNELATAVAQRLPITVLVLRDNALGMVREQQDTPFASLITPPDFVRLAEAYGAAGMRVSGISEAETAFAHAAALDAPCVIEIIIDPQTPSGCGGDRLYR